MANQQAARVVHQSEGFWLSWLGNPVNYLAEGEHTGGTYACSWGSFPPGDGHPDHRHDFEEGFYVLRGELTVSAGEVETTLQAGGFVNIGACTFHHLQNTGLATTEFLTIIARAGFEHFHREAGHAVDGPGGPFEVPSAEELARIHAIALRLGIDTAPLPDRTLERVHVKQAGEGTYLAAVGDLYRYLAVGDETNGRYGLWEALVPPGGGPPLHIQSREHEGFYILEGTMTFQADGARVEARPGTLLNVPPGCVHGFRNETDRPARMLIWVAPAGLERLFKETGTPVADPSGPVPLPSPEGIARLLEVAPRFGVTVIPPDHE